MNFENFLFWTIYFTTILVCFGLVRRSGVSFTQMNLPVLVFYSAMGLAFFGYPFIFFHFIEYQNQLNITEYYLLWKSLCLSSFVWIQVFFGYWLMARKVPYVTVQITSPEKERPLSQKAWWILFGMGVLATLLYLRNVPEIGILRLLKGGAERKDLQEVRSLMTIQFSGGRYWIFSLFFEVLLPFLSLIAWCSWLKFKDQKWKKIFLISFVVSCLALVMSLQKVPITYYLVSLILAYVITHRIELNFKRLLIAMTPVLAVVMSIYVLLLKSGRLEQALILPFERTLTGQLIPWYFYLQVYPDMRDFAHGATFPSFGGLLGWNVVNPAREVMDLTISKLYGFETLGSAPTAFMGELWVNFGYWGLMGIPMLVGMGIFLVHRVFVERPLGALGVAFYVWMIIHLSKIATKALSTYFFDQRFLLVLGVSLLFVLLRNWKGFASLNESRSFDQRARA